MLVVSPASAAVVKFRHLRQQKMMQKNLSSLISLKKWTIKQFSNNTLNNVSQTNRNNAPFNGKVRQVQHKENGGVPGRGDALFQAAII